MLEEDILVHYGLRRKIITTKRGEEKEIFFYDSREHYETWYWSIYTGDITKWRPPKDWDKKRRQLTSPEGVTYWEDYPYPKNSWRSATEKEVNWIKNMLSSGHYRKYDNIAKVKPGKIEKGKIAFESDVPWVISTAYYFPKEKLLVKKTRCDQEDI